MFRLDVDTKNFIKEDLTDEAAFAQGLGVFETIKISQGAELSEAEFLDEHLTRLAQGVKEFFPEAQKLDTLELKMATTDFMKSHGLSSGALKIVYAAHDFKSGTIYFNHDNRHYDEALYRNGVKIRIAQGVRNSQNPLLRYKTLSNMENMLELHAARTAGYFESIYLNEQGFVAEGTVSNIFWEKEGALFTPEEAVGILPGIMRGQIIKNAKQNGVKVYLGKFGLDELLSADRVFLTNSLMASLPVCAVENGSKMITYQQ